MENHFQAIGMLINDLRKGRNLLTEGIIEDLEQSFREILMKLGYAWYRKVAWLDYLLDFHAAEGERLRAFVLPAAGMDYPAVRACLYEGLTQLLEKLDLLINGDQYVELEDLM